MDNKKDDFQLPDNEAWLNELLGRAPATKEIGPDEQAVSAAGLTHPKDLEFEKIMQEILSESKKACAAEDFGATQKFNLEEFQQAEAAQKPITVDAKPVTDDLEEILKFTPKEVQIEDVQRAIDLETESVVENLDETLKFTPDELQREVAQQIAEPEVPEVPRKEIQEPVVLVGWNKIKAVIKKYGLSQLVTTVAWLILIVAIGSSLGRTLWDCAADLLAFGKVPMEVSVTVDENDSLADISNKLSEAGLIDRPDLFKLFAEITGKDKNISTGTFDFSDDRIYDYNAIIKAMTYYGPARDEVQIMFPEGYNCAQIFELLEEKGVCTVEQLEEYAANGELSDYWFLEGVPRGHKYSLEGYLAPDTYRFYTNDDPKRVLEKFLDEFDDRFNDDLRQKYISLNQYLSQKMAKNGYSSEYIASHQLTVHEVVIMASIIEKETANNLESYTIASVFYNRLTNLGSYPYLGSDATIVYAEKYYNKGEIKDAQDRKENPYNTYTHIGLTPGPIANPGLNSLGAALSPKDTSYYYFIYDKSIGEHRFSKTLAEHERWAAKLGL